MHGLLTPYTFRLSVISENRHDNLQSKDDLDLHMCMVLLSGCKYIATYSYIYIYISVVTLVVAESLSLLATLINAELYIGQANTAN